MAQDFATGSSPGPEPAARGGVASHLHIGELPSYLHVRSGMASFVLLAGQRGAHETRIGGTNVSTE